MIAFAQTAILVGMLTGASLSADVSKQDWLVGEPLRIEVLAPEGSLASDFELLLRRRVNGTWTTSTYNEMPTSILSAASSGRTQPVTIVFVTGMLKERPGAATTPLSQAGTYLITVHSRRLGLASVPLSVTAREPLGGDKELWDEIRRDPSILGGPWNEQSQKRFDDLAARFPASDYLHYGRKQTYALREGWPHASQGAARQASDELSRLSRESWGIYDDERLLALSSLLVARHRVSDALLTLEEATTRFPATTAGRKARVLRQQLAEEEGLVRDLGRTQPSPPSTP